MLTGCGYGKRWEEIWDGLPFPLQPPAKALEVMAIGSEVDKPQNMVDNIVKESPAKIAGFLPKVSDALPHRIAVKHWDKEKTADVIPLYFATSAFGIPKLSIISG
jgi:hypothetical protein